MSDIPGLPDFNNLCFAGSQQQTNSLLNDPNLASAIKKMVEVQLQVMTFPIVKRIVESLLSTLEPMMEDLVRKIVKEQIELVQERLFTREKWKSQDDPHTSQLRCLKLQFLDRVSCPVYTGKEIKGERGDSVGLALVDSDGNPVNSGPEATAKVEILVLQEGACDEEKSSTCGESQRMKNEKKGKKPLLSRTYLKLKEGVADLDNIKFKNKSAWTKSCEVKLVARVMENLDGTKVEDAKTEAFCVMDCRSTLYKKHYPPSLSDDVWRLEKIYRGSPLHKRLQEAQINSVKDFLISLNLDTRRLQETLDVSAEKFKVIVDHAQKCVIGGGLYTYYPPGSERKVSVVFDVVGRLRGLRREHLFVRVDDLAEDEKVDAHKMVVSAFEHREDVQLIDNEESVPDFPSQICNDVNSSISPRIEGPSGSNFGITSDGTGHALSRTSSWHLPPICSFGSTSFFDGTASNIEIDNMDFPSHGMNHSDLSRPIWEDWKDDQLIDNEAFLADFPSQLCNGVNSSISPRIEGPSGSNFGITSDGTGHALSRTSSWHLPPICSFGSTSFFDGTASNIQIDNIDFPSHGTNHSDLSRPIWADWEDDQLIDNEAFLADFPSQLWNGVNSSISPRIEGPSGSNFGICKTSDGTDRALSRTSSRHISSIYPFGSTSFFDGTASIPQMDNMNFLSHLQSENAMIESRTVAICCQTDAVHVHSSSQARLRWRMAVGSVRKRIMAPEDTHIQKKQRYSKWNFTKEDHSLL